MDFVLCYTTIQLYNWDLDQTSHDHMNLAGSRPATTDESCRNTENEELLKTLTQIESDVYCVVMLEKAPEVNMLTASREAAVRSRKHLAAVELWSFDHCVSVRLYQQTLESFIDYRR